MEKKQEGLILNLSLLGSTSATSAQFQIHAEESANSEELCWHFIASYKLLQKLRY